MAGPTNIEEAALLDTRLDNVVLWLGLSTTTPTETGSNIAEPSSGGYARVMVDGTDAAWAPAVQGNPASKANAVELTFPEATGDWSSGASMVAFILMSESVGGTLRYSNTVPDPKPVLTGDTARFAAGALRILLGDPSDTYA